MKQNNGFVMRNVGGENLLVPLGVQVMAMNGIVTLNNTGSYLWALLEQDRSLDELTTAVAIRFDVDHERANADVQAFLAELMRLGIVA